MVKEIKYKIIDNFLDKEEYKNFKNFLNSETIPWFFKSSEVGNNIDKKNKNGFFSFCAYNNGRPDHAGFFNLNLNILEKLKTFVPIQIRANCTFRDKDSIESDWHIDSNVGFGVTAILYLTTCNAKTVLNINNKKVYVDSLENRLLKFNSTIKHKLIYHTDVFKRIVVNYNYITNNGDI